MNNAKGRPSEITHGIANHKKPSGFGLFFRPSTFGLRTFPHPHHSARTRSRAVVAVFNVQPSGLSSFGLRPSIFGLRPSFRHRAPTLRHNPEFELRTFGVLFPHQSTNPTIHSTSRPRTSPRPSPNAASFCNCFTCKKPQLSPEFSRIW